MTVEIKKLTLIEHILHIEDEALLDQIRQLLSAHQPETILWNTLSEAEKQAIEEGLAQSEGGQGRSHEEVMAAYKAKYGL
jgi:predicted transcriptional regulator